jgi:E3 ubiquitin-protein ligase DOA10
MLALVVPLAFAYISQYVKTALGIFQDNEEVMANCLSTYPIFMVVVSVIAGIAFAKRAVDKWRDSVRDEIYLVGEVLHNLDEVER